MVLVRLNIRLIAALTVALSVLLLFTTVASAITLSTDERYMLNLLNKERRANGLKTLEVEPNLATMARRYCAEMIDNDFFSHTSPVSGSLVDRVGSAGIPEGWLLAGENLAGAPTVEAAFQGLMNSSSHKNNMLKSTYTHIGVGVVDGGLYGKMFVQEFIAYPENKSLGVNDPNYDLLIYANNQLLYLDPPAFIHKGHTLVPLASFFEEVGLDVKLDNADTGKNKKISLSYLNGNITLTVGGKIALVNGEQRILDAVPIMVEDSAFVPLRFIVENLGASIKWNSKLRVITITL